MNYTHLGRTGLKVSRLCLGTMNFGDVTDEKTSARILDEALEAVNKCGTDLRFVPVNWSLFRLLHPSDHLRFQVILGHITRAAPLLLIEDKYESGTL